MAYMAKNDSTTVSVALFIFLLHESKFMIVHITYYYAFTKYTLNLNRNSSVSSLSKEYSPGVGLGKGAHLKFSF